MYTRGPNGPRRPLAENFFLLKASTSQYLALVVSEILRGGAKFTLGVPVPPVRPQRKIFCTRVEYVTMSNGVFNFNFLALLLFEILGDSKFTLGALRPLDAPQRRNFYSQSEYFTMYNCVFNFNILALVLFGILGGPKFTLGGPALPRGPLSEKF